MLPLFLNPWLLLGGLLVGVPFVLHLIMRRKPRLLEFPALRFVRRRHDSNRRRLRLRHLLLLLLRAAVIAGLALALARPRMQFASVVGSQEAPVAAALVFDTAPHMEYRHENKTRLETAQETGAWLLTQLPRESQVAVLDTGLVQRAFDADVSMANQRIGRLSTVTNSQPLARAVAGAVAVLGESQLPRKEIYVFSDFSRAAWPGDSAAALQDQFSKVPGVAVYVTDVGVKTPTDFALGELRLSGQVLSNNSPLNIQTELSCIGPAGERIVELNMLDDQQKPQKWGQQSVTLESGQSKQVEFHVGGLAPGTHQGFVRIVGQDGLAANDTRSFTVEVQAAWKILVAAPSPAEEQALFLVQALAPDTVRRRGQAPFDCRVVDIKRLAQENLNEFAAVCLVDPTPLDPAIWQKLSDYVADGHGAAIFLGRNAGQFESFNTPAAQQLLPGKLLRVTRKPEGKEHLAPRDYQHPILAAFRRVATSTPWFAFPVFRYWELGDLQPGVGVVLRYMDDRPALLERPVGNGRVLVMTTPVSDRPNRDAWNLLPVDVEVRAWPFVILMNQMAAYLVGSGQQTLNYSAGQAATLNLDEQSKWQSYVLTTPGNLKFPLSADLEKHQVMVTSTEEVGNYQVQAGGAAGVKRGFSTNLTPDQTRLDRVSDEELKALFKPLVQPRLASNREEIDRSMNIARVGRELYPLLILLLALVLAAEYVVANRFYRRDWEGAGGGGGGDRGRTTGDGKLGAGDGRQAAGDKREEVVA